jgi:hypothetical protein
MACALTTGRELPAKQGFGGIKFVYFADYGTLGDVTVNADGTIDAIAGSPVWFQYDIKGASSLETTINSSRETGTTFYAQTLNLTLTYLEAATQHQIQLLAINRPHLVVEDYLGNQFLCGLENGVECTGGTIATGASAGDLSGFTLTFEGQEEKAPAFVDSGLITGSATQIVPNTCV